MKPFFLFQPFCRSPRQRHFSAICHLQVEHFIWQDEEMNFDQESGPLESCSSDF